jgi:diguanylate cyclase (GGDEF)-like protein
MLTNEFRRSVRYHTPLSLLMVDIDHFKVINDTFGHQTGDSVLKECARLFQSMIRQVDTVARYGGEEFVILSPNTSKDSIFQAADRIRKAFAAHAFPGLDNRPLTISIGTASIPDASLDTEEKFIHAADMAMYEAKKKGRNRVETT